MVGSVQQAALALPDSFYTAVFHSSTDAIITKDLKGVITSVNPAAERLFGYAAAEMVGQSVTMLFPPDRLAEETIILGRIARGEYIEHFETVRRRKDGALLDISLNVSPIRDATGRIVGASKIARDITESKRLLERTRVTLASIADAVIATDTGGNVTFLNAAAEGLTGWKLKDAIGRPLTAVFNIINESTRKQVENP